MNKAQAEKKASELNARVPPQNEEDKKWGFSAYPYGKNRWWVGFGKIYKRGGKTMDNEHEYGYRLGLQDGRVAAQWVEAGRPVSHGDLLSANDPYAQGYRDGLNERREG